MFLEFQKACIKIPQEARESFLFKKNIKVLFYQVKQDRKAI